MRSYKYEYALCRENNPDVFKEACDTISSTIMSLKASKLLEDVDGTTIQIYEDDEGRRIVVYDDYDIGAVYVLSDLEIREKLRKFIV